ncbi:hypothetical protein GMMP15_1240021 [Candidatus Magnetomoraceae bacterium gMMP-15]
MLEETGILSLTGIDPKATSVEAEALNLGAVYTALLTHSSDMEEGKKYSGVMEKGERLSALEMLNKPKNCAG